MHLVFHKVSYFYCIIFYISNFKYKSVIVNDTKHYYNITVKLTETYT